MSAVHPAALASELLEQQCEVKRTRRGGPGGQHRNKVETAVVITHRPSGIQGAASERRSQAENLQVAWQRLRVNLALSIRYTPDAEASLSDRWQARLRAAKMVVSTEHVDFPALLAEALDQLNALDWDVKTCADLLGISSSQLVKFLAREPRALSLLNAVRRERGHPEYR